MGNKKLFAKVGVFLLLVLNVAAYWFFWPNYRSGAMNASKSGPQEKGELRILPKPPEAAPGKPREIPASTVNDAIPLAPVSGPYPALPPTPVGKSDPADLLNRLQEHIKKENKGQAKPSETIPPFLPPDVPGKEKGDPAKKTLHDPSAPRPLPPLETQGSVTPMVPSVELPNKSGGAAVPAAGPVSPWLLHMETIGNRTNLTARLHPTGTPNPIAEFRISCDRVDPNEPKQQLVAQGNVVFTGGGLRGECKSATLMVLEGTIVFDGQVLLGDPAAPSQCYRSERLVWGASPTPREEARPIVPAALGVPR